MEEGRGGRKRGEMGSAFTCRPSHLPTPLAQCAQLDVEGRGGKGWEGGNWGRT